MPLAGEPRDHMNALLGVLLPFARDAIGQHGTFFPIGASMAPDGELAAAAVTPEEHEPSAEGLLVALRRGFKSVAGRGELLATGVASDVAIPQGDYPFGIRVELEHAQSEPITCVVPYREIDESAYEYGDVVAFPGDRHVWA